MHVNKRNNTDKPEALQWRFHKDFFLCYCQQSNTRQCQALLTISSLVLCGRTNHFQLSLMFQGKNSLKQIITVACSTRVKAFSHINLGLLTTNTLAYTSILNGEKKGFVEVGMTRWSGFHITSHNFYRNTKQVYSINNLTIVCFEL